MVKRTTVDLDMDAVARAQEVLGTRTIRETLDAALREVDRFAALRRGAEIIRSGHPSLVRPEDLPRLRRSRL